MHTDTKILARGFESQCKSGSGEAGRRVKNRLSEDPWRCGTQNRSMLSLSVTRPRRGPCTRLKENAVNWQLLTADYQLPTIDYELLALLASHQPLAARHFLPWPALNRDDGRYMMLTMHRRAGWLSRN